VKVRLNEAAVSANSGQGTLRGLSVGNPKGFKTPTAFELDEISLTLDIGRITSDPIVIKEILGVAAPRDLRARSSGEQYRRYEPLRRRLARCRSGDISIQCWARETAYEIQRAVV
jgi:hypothetical protein